MAYDHTIARFSSRRHALPLIAIVPLLSLLLSPFRARAQATSTITVDTSAISGTPAQLAFDLINGGSASNTLTIFDFSTDGTLGGVFPTGEVSGTLPGPVTLMDSPSSFFNEYLTDLTLGSTFSFVEASTTNGPSIASLPDAFSLFLVNPTTGLPLFSTTDPSGSDSLLTLNIDGTPQGDLNVYAAPGGEVIVMATPVTPVSVPEPATWLLVTAGLLSFLLLRRLRETRLYFG